VTDELFEKVDATTWGVVIAEIFVAVAQAILGGIALWLVGIPNRVFWTFVMIVLALLPMIGAFFVWAPAATYLVAIDQEGSGLFLFVYGLLVISLVDNYARPIVIDRDAHLNPSVVIIGVFGGIYAIGITGLFIGPIVLAVLAATITAFDEEYDTLGETERAHDQ
jgi:predicted PurR-regulated permease PerM